MRNYTPPMSSGDARSALDNILSNVNEGQNLNNMTVNRNFLNELLENGHVNNNNAFRSIYRRVVLDNNRDLNSMIVNGGNDNLRVIMANDVVMNRPADMRQRLLASLLKRGSNNRFTSNDIKVVNALVNPVQRGAKAGSLPSTFLRNHINSLKMKNTTANRNNVIKRLELAMARNTSATNAAATARNRARFQVAQEGLKRHLNNNSIESIRRKLRRI
jgi:hypothetical protein